ncbi:hypothetical protein BcDW1_5197 [Botrytis cinerea BcDW1]|uniref:Uncharacterized protein n=1 Tax=Botryotinia fuckeliana (strain BcDW1) TaxID=1290391 RepID=M7TXY8_BOTF1|nr:hypothetical protein BcDW1_5197 [Botrytis cinerea BcDW1]
MASTNQKSSSQRHFTFMKTHFAPKSPILGERDSSVDELDNVSVTNPTSTSSKMSRGKATVPSWSLQSRFASRKPFAAMGRQNTERQSTASPEFTPASPPAFTPVGFTNQRSPELGHRSPSFNPGSPSSPRRLFSHFGPRPQSPTSGLSSLPNYQSPGLNHREHFAPYAVAPQSFFAMQPRPPLPNASLLTQPLDNMNDSYLSWKNSNVSSRKRPSERVDDFFAPPPKRRESSTTQLFGLYHETISAADQILQNARDRVYASRHQGTLPVERYMEMSNCGNPANLNNYAGNIYQKAPQSPGALASDYYNRPRASFSCQVECASTETMSGESEFAIQRKPVFAPFSVATSFQPAAATEQTHRNEMSFGSSPITPQLPRFSSQFSLPDDGQYTPQLPSFSSLFSHPDHSQYSQLPSSKYIGYPTELPHHTAGPGSLLSPSPQRSIRAEVFQSLEARQCSIDSESVESNSVNSDSIDPPILQSYARPPASSGTSVQGTKNQNSIEIPPITSPQEGNSINRQDTDSDTLAEDTPRISIEAADNSDNESAVSYHSNNNNNDILILGKKLDNIGAELFEVQHESRSNRMDLDNMSTQNRQFDTRVSTLCASVEDLKELIQIQSAQNTQSRDEVTRLKEEAVEQKSRFEELVNLVVEVTNRSNLHGGKIEKLTQQGAAEAGNEDANNNGDNVDEVAALKKEVARLQQEVLTLQNEALKKEVAELRASRDV